MVKLFQPHRFRVTQLLPPHEVARFSQQPASGGSSPAAAGAAPKAGVPPGSGSGSASLPYVPEYFSLAEVVRVDDRLLLRHAEGGATPPAGAGEGWGSGSGVSGWAAAGPSAALSSPSCILRSLAFLFWGGGATSGGAPTGAAATPAPASPTAAPHGGPGHLQQPTLAPLRQQSSEWTLAAMPSAPRGAGAAPAAAAGGRRSSAGAAPPAPAPALDHAVSVDARSLLSEALGSGGTGSMGGEDSGHLVPPGSASTDAASGSGSVVAAPAERSVAEAGGGAAPAEFWWQYC